MTSHNTKAISSSLRAFHGHSTITIKLSPYGAFLDAIFVRAEIMSTLAAKKKGKKKEHTLTDTSISFRVKYPNNRWIFERN